MKRYFLWFIWNIRPWSTPSTLLQETHITYCSSSSRLPFEIFFCSFIYSYFKSLTTTYAHEHGTSIVVCTDWQCGILKPKRISSFPLPSTSQTVVGPQETFCSPCFIFVWSGLMIFRSYTCIPIVCSLVQQPYHVMRRAFFNTPTPPPKLRLF